MITDIHCHYIPRDFFALVRDDPAYAVRVKAREAERVDLDVGSMHFGLNTTFFDVSRQIARMDGLGIERSILSLATPLVNYEREGEPARRAARVCNDGLAEVVASDPARFGAWAFLPMQDPAAAAGELRRAVTELGFVGGHIATNVRGVYPDDERFRPVFDAAVELDAPLFMHPANPAGKDRSRDYELTVVAGYLFDSTLAIFRLICSGFADRYPRLKLVCAHTGAFSLTLRARMQREVDTNPDLSRRLRGPIGDYLARFYYDTICFEPDILRYAATVVPSEHLLMGSDGPFPLGEPDPVGFVRRALADEGRASRVLRDNARALLGG